MVFKYVYMSMLLLLTCCVHVCVTCVDARKHLLALCPANDVNMCVCVLIHVNRKHPFGVFSVLGSTTGTSLKMEYSHHVMDEAQPIFHIALTDTPSFLRWLVRWLQ